MPATGLLGDNQAQTSAECAIRYRSDAENPGGYLDRQSGGQAAENLNYTQPPERDTPVTGV